MNTSGKEIEIKIKIEDPEKLFQKILDMGGKEVKEDGGFERDIMYDDGKGFFDAHKVLRLRKAPYGNLLTYKEKFAKTDHKNLLERVELQTKVSDYEAVDSIIKKIGFVPYRIKEKNAKYVRFIGHAVEFHALPFLGSFIEIEGNEMGIKNVLEKIGLNFNDGINKDYTALFMEFCAQKGILESTPQTFEEEKKYLQKTSVSGNIPKH
jgi:predicted adenylyl cyclase CyaB